MKFLWLEFGSIEDVQLDFIKTAWGGKNWPLRLQKHIETKFKFYIYISICQLSLPWLDWPCIIIVVYAGLKWIGFPWKIALVSLYLFYQIQEIRVFLYSLFFCYRLNRLVGTKKHLWNIHIDRICIQHETHVWLKNFLVKETLPEQVCLLFFFVFLFVKNSGCRINFNQ